MIPSLVQKPKLLKTLETDLGTSIAESIWGRVRDQEQWMNESIPIGIIIFFYESQTYAGGGAIAAPDPNYWQICNGSAITNPRSPMNGQNTPNLMGRYAKHTIGGMFMTGGQSGISLPHSHTGVTSTTAPYSGNGTESGSDGPFLFSHYHNISSDPGNASFDPPRIDFQPYMRIV